MSAEEELNNSLECLGDLVKDTAGARQQRSEVLAGDHDMIDEFQSRASRRGSPGQETTVLILVERPQ